MEPEKTPEELEIAQILFKDSKKFVDNTRIYIAQGYFALRLNIGESGESFAMTPRTAKVLAHFLTKQVAHYEAAIAAIPLDLSVPSPLTSEDLQSPDSGGSAPPDKKKPKK